MSEQTFEEWWSVNTASTRADAAFEAWHARDAEVATLRAQVAALEGQLAEALAREVCHVQTLRILDANPDRDAFSAELARIALRTKVPSPTAAFLLAVVRTAVQERIEDLRHQ